MAENDVQNDLKKRARRRLVGAIALALVAAILLPVVMDSEPRQSGEELSIRIPSQEGANFASQLIKGNAPPPGAPEMPADSAPAGAELAVPDEAPPPPDAQPALPTEAPAPVVASKPPVVEHKSSSSSSASSRQSHSSSSRASAPKKVDDAKRARDILEGVSSSEQAPKPVAAGKVYVQVGVFRDAENAREMAAKAAAAGVKVNVESMADGRMRVRVAASDRAAAEKLVEKLKKAGLPGIVSAK